MNLNPFEGLTIQGALKFVVMFLVVSFVVRTFVPESFKTYFRI
jgi:hypothetical protein